MTTTITSIVPGTASIGDQIEIFGSGFNAPIGWGGDGRIVIGGVNVDTYTFFNYDHLYCVVPEGITASPADVVVYGSVSQNDYSNAYPIEINGIAPPAPVVVGLSIDGQTDFIVNAANNFLLQSINVVWVYDDSSTSPANPFDVTWNYIVLGPGGQSADVSINQMMGLLTSDYSGQLQLTPSAGGYTSAVNAHLDILPIIGSIGPTEVTQGQEVTLGGIGFQSIQTRTTATLQADPEVNKTVTSVTNTQLKFTIDANVATPTVRAIKFQVGTSYSNSMNVTQNPSLSVPVITAPTPTTTSNGATINITASNLEPGSLAYLDGQQIQITGGGAGYLEVVIPSEIPQTVTLPLTVSNTAGLSAPWSLTIEVPVVLVAIQLLNLAIEVAPSSQTELKTAQTVTAYYSDESTADVTNSCTFAISFDPLLYEQIPPSSYDPATPQNTGTISDSTYTATANGGIYNLVVTTYTEGGVTKELPFGIGVSIPVTKELLYITALPSNFSCQPGASYDVKTNSVFTAYFSDQTNQVVTTDLTFSVLDRPEHGSIDLNGVYTALATGGPDAIVIVYSDNDPAHVPGKTATTYISADVPVPVPPDTSPRITEPTGTRMYKGVDFEIFGLHLAAITYVAILDKNMNLIKVIDTFVSKDDNKIVIAGFDDVDLKEGYILATTEQFQI